MLEFADRKQSDCYKWDSDEATGKLPLWVADMDFKAAQPILAALQRRLDHGVFGYGIVPQEYFNAVSRWFATRHNMHGISKENSIPVTGVVPAIAAVLKAVSMRKRKPLEVLTLTPAYNCFFSCINNLDCQLLSSPLTFTDDGFKVRYSIDFVDFERKAQTADVFLLCNPHNPTGRVWTKQELQRMADICRQNDVFVLSDEIHCEFCFPQNQYIPYSTITSNDNYCVCTSASKSFNIAGLQCANIFVPNAVWYEYINRAVNIHETGELNPFGIVATIAAYNESGSWLDELNSHIFCNYVFLTEYLQKNLPLLHPTAMEGTYLAWVRLPDNITLTATEFCDLLAEQQKVLFNPSEMYGTSGFIRINLATSRSVLQQALERLRRFVSSNF